MTLAPLTTGPHLVPANRLAFTTPVREAGQSGWITLHAHGEEDEGTVHVFVGASGYIEKGPSALCHQHIGQLASHSAVAKTTRHPAGHEPEGARSHPDFKDAGPKPAAGAKIDTAPLEAQRDAAQAEGHRLSQRIYSLRDQGKPGLTARAQKDYAAANERLKVASDALYKAHEDNAAEPAKRPGKPYARLSGADQGTRAEQIGKALGEAQEAAKGAKAEHGEAHTHLSALPEPVQRTLREAGVTVQMHQGTQAEALPKHGVSTPMAKLGPADAGYDSRTGTAHFFGGKAERYNVHHELGHALDDALGYQATGKHHTPYSSQPEFQALYRKHKENMNLPPPMRHSASEMFADAFAMHHDVLHQEGETADGDPRMVHRGRKLERAAPDLHAHMAALSKGEARPQQSAQKPEDKIADTAVAHQQAQADLAAHRAKVDRNPNPWAPHLSPPVGDAKDRELAEKATRAQLAHQAAQAQQQGQAQAEQTEGQRAHEKEMVRLKAEQATEQSARAAGASASDARILANQVRAGHGLIRGKRPHNPEQAPATSAFSAPAAKEKPQTAPQPEQPAGAPAPKPAATARRGAEPTTYTSHQLSEMEPEQREVVAADKNTHPETLHELGLWNRTYAQKVARNPSTHPETLHAMTQDMPYDPKMDAGIARHKNARADTLHHLAVHGDNPAKALVAAHPNASEATRQHLMDNYPTSVVGRGLAKNPHTSAEHLEHLRSRSYGDNETQEAIAQHPNADEGSLHILARQNVSAATAMAARKAPLPTSVMDALMEHKAPAVHKALLDRADLPGRHVYQLARYGVGEVARKAQGVMDKRDTEARTPARKSKVRESAAPAPRFSAPAMR